MKQGTIKNITNIMSGLQTITFEDDSEVSIENFGVRQLFNIFNDESPIGKKIEYDINEYNIMTGFDILK